MVQKNPIEPLRLHEWKQSTNIASGQGENLHDFHQFTRLKTGNDLVAELLRYSSIFIHYIKLKNDEISLYSNVLGSCCSTFL